MSPKPRVLVVDDEKLIREMIADFLEQDYAVTTANSGESALALPGIAGFDLVISDINMPGIPGYELLKRVRQLSPRTKVVLITAYDVDNYVRMAKEHGVCNIISKTVPFNFSELAVVVRNLISGDIFGIEKYMAPGFQRLDTYTVRSSAEAKDVREDILKLFLQHIQSTGELRLVLDEIVTNALYHSPRDPQGNEKYKEFSNIVLDETEFITLDCVIDHEKYGVGIVDRQGSLSKETVLYKIDRHIKGEGILDDSGRGLFMSRIFADRLIVNIDPGNKTEIIVLNYRSPIYQGFKP
ncbi:MAG: response regulator, partial [Fibrobacterota bacterium]